MKLDERKAIRDVVVLRKSLCELALVFSAFVFAYPLRLEPATIAMFSGAVLLLPTNVGRRADRRAKGVHHTYAEVE